MKLKNSSKYDDDWEGNFLVEDQQSTGLWGEMKLKNWSKYDDFLVEHQPNRAWAEMKLKNSSKYDDDWLLEHKPSTGGSL